MPVRYLPTSHQRLLLLKLTMVLSLPLYIKKGGWNKPHPPSKNMIYYNDFTDKVKHRRRTRLLLELPKYGGTSTMDKP